MASVGYKEKDWNVPRHTGAMIKLGLKVELFDIDEQNPLLLEQYGDICYGRKPILSFKSNARGGMQRTVC